MLPSGNDSAHCLAEYFGGILKQQAEEQEEQEKIEHQKEREELLRQKEIEDAIIFREDELQKELKLDSTIEGESIAHLPTAEGSNAAASSSSADCYNAGSKLK